LVTDWGAWSRESVALMTARANERMRRHDIPAGAPYHWELEAAKITIGEATFRLVTVGTVVNDQFLWSWANDAIPATAKVGIERARQFGIDNDSNWVLTDPWMRGGLAQAKECLVLAGRILNADGVWIDQTESGYIRFILFELA
jgi:hypothetical protein